jgi:hypothetical protein
LYVVPLRVSREQSAAGGDQGFPCVLRNDSILRV